MFFGGIAHRLLVLHHLPDTVARQDQEIIWTTQKGGESVRAAMPAVPLSPAGFFNEVRDTDGDPVTSA